MARIELLPGNRILSLEIAREKYGQKHCDHWKVIVNEKFAKCECGDCGKELNPMWVLTRYANEESRFVRERKAYIEAYEAYEKRSRTKCQHCGKITRING